MMKLTASQCLALLSCAENDKQQTKTKTTSKTKIMLQVQHSFPLEKSETEPNFSVENYNMDVSYCLCGQPYDPNIFMIQCDACKDWFHSRYVTANY